MKIETRLDRTTRLKPIIDSLKEGDLVRFYIDYAKSLKYREHDDGTKDIIIDPSQIPTSIKILLGNIVKKYYDSPEKYTIQAKFNGLGFTIRADYCAKIEKVVKEIATSDKRGLERLLSGSSKELRTSA